MIDVVGFFRWILVKSLSVSLATKRDVFMCASTLISGTFSFNLNWTSKEFNIPTTSYDKYKSIERKHRKISITQGNAWHCGKAISISLPYKMYWKKARENYIVNNFAHEFMGFNMTCLKVKRKWLFFLTLWEVAFANEKGGLLLSTAYKNNKFRFICTVWQQLTR